MSNIVYKQTQTMDTESLCCPITKCIFLHPVTLPADGYTYEREEITKWIRLYHTSPMTRQPVLTVANIHENIAMKHMVDMYLTDHPDKKNEQYVEAVAVAFDPREFDAITNQAEQELYIRTCVDIDASWNIAHLCQTAEMSILRFIAEDHHLWRCPARPGWKVVHYICRWAPERFDEQFTPDMHISGEDGLHPLHLLCSYGSLADVRLAVEDMGADVECVDVYGYRPIHYACERNRADIIRYLATTVRVDINAATNDGMCPLHFACQLSEFRTIRCIVTSGADLESANDMGYRPIHIVCEHATEPIIRYFINRGVELNVPTERGQYPIHYLCKRKAAGIPSIIRYAMTKGIDMDCESSDHIWPIHILCTYTPISFIAYLFARGINMERSSRTGVRPIHILCRRCTDSADRTLIDLIKRMTWAGVDIHTPDQRGVYPIHYICESAPPEMIHFFIHPNTNIDFNVADNRGLTPLHYLCYRKMTKLIRRLLEQNCAVDPMAEDGIRPIHILLTNKPMVPELVCALIARGVNLYTGPSPNMVPLHLMYRTGRLDILKFALEREHIQSYVYPAVPEIISPALLFQSNTDCTDCTNCMAAEEE